MAEVSAGASSAQIRAGGGVVARPGAEGGVEVVLVHRPRYDDWTFPKGKVDAGEQEEAAARREVEEETGLVCRLGPELASCSYSDRKGRTKVVRYWLMQPEGPAQAWLAESTGEVDQVKWLSVEAAGAALTYERDREVLRSAAAALATS